MKRLFTSLLLGLTMLSANAQYQVTNSNFEQWESVDGGEEPVHWSSFLTASGSMAGSVKAEQLKKSTNVRPGSTGTYSAHITARSVLGIAIAQGNMTTGQINGGSMTATDANGNYNWTNTSDANFNMPFTGYPDASRVWINFYAKNSAHTGKISAYLHGNGYYQDPNTGNTGQLVQLMAGAQAKPARTATSSTYSANSWQQVTVPFEYVAGVNARPSYALVSFATNSTPGSGTEGDFMYIDDMELLYFSELATATYNGVDINFTNGTASVNGGYNVKLVKFTSNGHGATIEQSFNEDSYLLTVTVKGDNISEDPTNFHTYTIQFTGIASGDDDQSSAVVVPETTLTNVDIQAGAFYVKNVATGTYLGNNNALSATPHKWNITGNGAYKFIDDSSKAMQLTRKSSNSSFSASRFNVLSNASSSNATEFTTSVQDDGSYQLYSYIQYYDGLVFGLGAKSDNIYYAATNANALTCQIQGSTDNYSKWALIDPMQYIRVNEFWPNYASASLTNGVEVKGFITAGSAQTVSGLPLGIYGFAGEDKFYLPFGENLEITAAQSNKTLTYYGRLDLSLNATYDGVAIQGGSTVDAVYEASKLTVNLTGNGAQEYATSFDEETYVLTIMVRGYGRMNEYEIQFAAPSMTLAAQWYGEDIEDGAVIDEEYDATHLTLTSGRGTTATPSYDATTGLLTVTLTSVYGETQDFTFQFAIYPEVVSSVTYDDYTKMLQTCDGEPYDETTPTVTIQTLANNNINFVLNSFATYNPEGEIVNLGTLIARNIKKGSDGKFTFSGNIRTAQGTLVPVTISAQQPNDETLYAAVTVFSDNILTYFSYGITEENTTTFTDDIYVTINGEDAGHKESVVNVAYLSNGNINFTLYDFQLDGIGKIGSIGMKNLNFDSTTGDFSYTGNLYITPGTTGRASEWLGPNLGAIPVVLRGQIINNTMTLVIDIDFREQMDQVIHVTFGCVPTTTETFTDDLVVTINGESTNPQDATVTVGHLNNGNINFVLKNFSLNGVGAVGNISIENIQFNDEDGTFNYNGTVFIGKGDDTSINDWLGPTLGIIPLEMKGQIYTVNNTRYLLATIDIDMQESLGQTIHVTYGATPISTETYTDDLVVSINGIATTKPNTVVTVGHLKNGNINFTLADFTLEGVGGVGNIALDNLTLDAEGKFTFTGVTRIGKGSDDDIDWLGPTLGDIPLVMNGQLYTYDNQKYLMAVIDIDMQESIQQTIHVTFGIHPVSTKTFTDDLVVNVNGAVTPAQDATVTVGMLGNGNINFTLNDFILAGGAYVGNIALENLEVDEQGKFTFNNTTRIAAGSDNTKDWLGPTLGDVPINMKGQFYTYNNEERLIAIIDIDMTDASLNQMIHVTFGATPVSTESVDGEIRVTVNSVEADPIDATVTLGTLGNGNLNFVLNNFCLGDIKVGNISLENLEIESNGQFTYNGITRIGAGDEDIATFDQWLGPQLGNVPLDLTGTITANNVTVNITIDMRDTSLNQMIYVVFTASRGGVVGDVDGNGSLEPADIETLSNMVVRKIEPNAAADVNNDGKVSVADITTLVNILNSL